MKLGLGLLAATLFPAPLRDRWAFRLALPLATWAVAFSLFAAVAGGIAWALGWLAWMEQATAAASDVALGQVSVPNRGGLMFFGPLQALAYLFTPLGAGLGYVTLTGAVRSGVWAAIGEVPGDPIVSLGVAAAQALRSLRARHRAGLLLGEPPPDLVRETVAGSLEIVCAGARADLAMGASVEVDGRFYRVVDVRQARYGKRTAVVHDLRELSPQGVLRGFVRYR